MNELNCSSMNIFIGVILIAIDEIIEMIVFILFKLIVIFINN